MNRNNLAGHNINSFSHNNLINQGNIVRNNFYGGGYYNHGWYNNHFGCWWPGGWYGGGFWAGLSFGALAGFCGLGAVPIPYNYGTTVVYSGDTVLVNGTSAGTPAEYYQQASNIASVGNDAKLTKEDEWQVLGLYALTKDKEKDATNMLQLAINKDGIVRGNFYNSVSDTTLPVNGSVDKKTQRVAWTVGDNKKTVYEAGIQNLTQEQATCLVHYSDKRTDQLILSRLKEPEDMNGNGNTTDGSN